MKSIKRFTLILIVLIGITSNIVFSATKSNASDDDKVTQRATRKQRVEGKKEENGEEKEGKPYNKADPIDVKTKISQIKKQAAIAHVESTILPLKSSAKTTSSSYSDAGETSAYPEDFLIKIAQGDVENVKKYLHSHNHNGAKKAIDDINAKNSFGFRPLEYAFACENPSMEIIDHLLYAGADINRQNDEGNTPMYWAMLNPNINSLFFKALLSRRVNINNQLFDILRKNSVGNTILIETMEKYDSETDDASNKRLAEIFKVLLENYSYSLNPCENFNALLKKNEVLSKIYEGFRQRINKEIIEPKMKDEKKIDEVNEKFPPYLLNSMESLRDMFNAGNFEFIFCYDEKAVTNYLRENMDKYLNQITPSILRSFLLFNKIPLLAIFLNRDNVNYEITAFNSIKKCNLLAYALLCNRNLFLNNLEVFRFIIEKGAKINSIVLEELLIIVNNVQKEVDMLRESKAYEQANLSLNKLKELVKIFIDTSIDMLIEVPVNYDAKKDSDKETFLEAMNRRPECEIIRKVYSEYHAAIRNEVYQIPAFASFPPGIYDKVIKGYL